LEFLCLHNFNVVFFSLKEKKKAHNNNNNDDDDDEHCKKIGFENSGNGKIFKI